ncbi:MAG: carboxylating nicotinate-nucleotide diphosphorylase [bacterium]
MLVPPASVEVSRDVAIALAEDVGSGDLTAAMLPPVEAEATIICREEAVIAGLPWVLETFRQVDDRVVVTILLEDGQTTFPGDRVVAINGNASSILTAERVALNFLQTLSATATATAQFVKLIADTGARVLDTRKTLPGMRLAQKYAVRCGGGSNHRMGLHDAILIKENHIAAAGSVGEALALATQVAKPATVVEIEVESLEELAAALAAGANHVLLDNFSPVDLREAVALNAGRARLEASGGVNLNTIRDIATTGVNDISVGSITKDIQAVDYSLLFANK